jgi:thymidine kinase
MDSGKSTLALQTNHNHAVRGRAGRIFTTKDRAGAATLSSRLGLTQEALEVEPAFDFWNYVVMSLTHGARIDYLICDEAQFYTREQIEQLARIVDELQIDVFAFGILTDFRSEMFPGSARLVELADRMQVLQVEALCWCGKRATHNARTEDGVMVTEGEVIMVGDISGADAPVEPGDVESGPRVNGSSRPATAEPEGPTVGYEVLCRQHHRRKLTAARAKAVSMVPDPLPFD